MAPAEACAVARRAARMRHAWTCSLLGLVLLALSGCKAAIYTRMTEIDANDTLYTLLQGGVDAEKRVDPEGGFAVWAEKDDVARALGLLKANAQPEQKHPSLGELFGRNQLISTPVEERIRFIYGIEQALAQTLSKIDGVLVARVHIVLPVNDPLAAEVKPSSASVFIKHRAGQDMASSVPAVKELVVRGIEGLGMDRVAVTLFPASAAALAPPGADALALPISNGKFLGVTVPASSVGALWLRFTLLAALLAALLVLVLRMFRGADKPRAAPSSVLTGQRAARSSQG
jgi:type III secretion protein J